MESKNKLRRQRSKSPMIVFGVMMFLILLTASMYVTYVVLDYQNVNQIEQLSKDDFLPIFNTLTAPTGSLEITGSLVMEILKLQVTKLWWLYLLFVFVLFLAATSNTKDDFHGMEQGSARWADKYDEKQFKDQTGIPIGTGFYVTITNPKHKYYVTHNLNEIIIGGSGARKTFGKISPDIMQMTGSYVMTDPKGELYKSHVPLHVDGIGYAPEHGTGCRCVPLENR